VGRFAKALCVISLALPGLISPVIAAGQAPPKGLLEQAEEKFKKDDYDGAIADCTRVIDTGGTNLSEAFCSRAYYEVWKKDISGAFADFDNAIKLDPNNENAYVGRGILKTRRNDYSGAIADYTKAIDLNHGSWSYYARRARSESWTGDLDAALTDMDHAIQLEPNYYGLYSARAWIKCQKGSFDSAIADAYRAIKLDPKEPFAYEVRGWARYEKGDGAGAIEDCNKAIELCPPYYSPLFPQGLRDFISGNYEEAKARQAGMGPAQRQSLRQEQGAPVMAALKLRLVEIRQQIAPGGKLAQACHYALRQWSRLEEYLKDGLLEIDNNWCEGAMRPLALGRKNWLHLGSPEAGPKVAAIASIVETCRRLDINLRAYLTDVLPKLGDWPANRVAQLTPAAWKAAQQISS
jgi:Flp pilus assembly protein TadD